MEFLPADNGQSQSQARPQRPPHSQQHHDRQQYHHPQHHPQHHLYPHRPQHHHPQQRTPQPTSSQYHDYTVAKCLQDVTALQSVLDHNECIQLLHRLQLVLGYDQAERRCKVKPEVIKSMLDAGLINAMVFQMKSSMVGILRTEAHSSKPVTDAMNRICSILESVFVCFPLLLAERSGSGENSTRNVENRNDDDGDHNDDGDDSSNGRETFEIFNLLVQYLLQRREGGNVLSPLVIFHSHTVESDGVMALVRTRGLLRSLAQIAQQLSTSVEIQFELLGVLKNITYYSEEYRDAMAQRMDLLHALCQMCMVSQNTKVKEKLSAIFRNMAISANARTHLADQGDLAMALMKMMKMDGSKYMLRNAINTVVTLSIDYAASISLIFHGDGALLVVLKQLVVDCTDTTARKRAIRALRQMTNDASAPFLVHDTSLINALSNQAQYDASVDIRHEAMEAFAHIACLVRYPMVEHSMVLNRLASLADHRCISADVLARVLKHQSLHMENMMPIGKHRTLISTSTAVVTTAESTRSAKQDFCEALINLLSDDGNKEVLATKHILDALAGFLSTNNDAMTPHHHLDPMATVRHRAFQALQLLSQVESNRKGMSGHATLLKSLLAFASHNADDNETKRQVKQMILLLAVTL